MALYIWLMFHRVVIECTQTGCHEVTLASFNYIATLGGLELIFEMFGIVRIFSKKAPPPGEGPSVITKHK